MKKKIKKIDRIAIHEAGHAVMVLILNHTFKFAKITPSKTTGGVVKTRRFKSETHFGAFRKVPNKDAFKEVAKRPKTRRQILDKHIQIFLAGCAAEMHHLRGCYPTSSINDFRESAKIVAELKTRRHFSKWLNDFPEISNRSDKEEVFLSIEDYETRRYLNGMFAKTFLDLSNYSISVKEIARYLVKNKTISYEKSKEIFGYEITLLKRQPQL